MRVLAAGTDEELTEKFRQALHDVDRIVLQEERFGPAAQTRVVLELAGADSVREFGALVEAEQRTTHCLCITSPVIKLYAGSDLRFTLTLHHSDRLRDENGPWQGDVRLTASSAERFRNWFSDKGYHGFVDAHAAMLRAQAEHRANEEELQAQFPDGSLQLPVSDEYLGLETQRARMDGFRERVPDASRRILAYWRGLGSLQLWAQYRGHPAEFMLYNALESEEPKKALEALRALHDGDRLAWLGAYYHFSRSRTGGRSSSEEPLVFGIRDEAALLKLVQRKTAHDSRDAGWPTLMVLKHYDVLLVVEWLTEVARGSLRGQERPGAAIPLECWAMLLLAEKNDRRAGEMARERLRDSQLNEQEKRALEIVLARVDPSVALRADHLAVAQSDFAEAAWYRLKDAVATWPIDVLVALYEKAENYGTRRNIEQLLTHKGLRFLSEKERFADVWKKGYEQRVRSLESTREARRQVEATREDSTRDRIRERLLARLLYHEGRHLNRLGEYAAARSCLIQAEREDAREELAVACLGLGLLDQASVHLVLDSPGADLLRLGGFIAFARGAYDDAATEFDTAARLDLVAQEAVLFAHLAHVLAGKPARSRLLEWIDPLGDFGVLGADGGKSAPHWPDAAILHLQGKLPWDALVAEVHSMRGESRATALFSLSVISRLQGDEISERAFLNRALESKDFANPGYLLAALRIRTLGTAGE